MLGGAPLGPRERSERPTGYHPSWRRGCAVWTVLPSIRPILLVLFAAHGVLLFWNLGLLPVWGDEQFSLNVVASEWAELPGILARDIHPPLYFLAAKVWMGLPWPGDDIVRLRQLSALGALVGGFLFWWLWLRGRATDVVLVGASLWVLSPPLLMYSRMGRSYSWQVAAGLVALWAAARWLDEDRPRRAWLGFAGALLVCAYLHYLPAIAIGVATGLLWGWRAVRRRSVPYAEIGAALGVVGLGYLPWLGVMLGAVRRVAAHDAYAFTGSALSEWVLRLCYSAVVMAVGETPSVWLLGLLAVLIPLVAYLGWRGWSGEAWMIAAAIAGVVGFFGASAWVAFSFVPARILFALPFLFLLLAVAVTRRRRLGFALVALMVLVQCLSLTNYMAGANFLNPGYMLDAEPLANEVRAAERPAIVLTDGYNLDPLPLLARLPDHAAVESTLGSQWRGLVVEADPGTTVFVLRSTRDISPDGTNARLDAVLSKRCDARISRLVPVSPAAVLLASFVSSEVLRPHRYEWIRCTVER